MPNILANIAKMDSATTGTGTLTLGAAVTGYLSFANAGVTNGQVVTYAIEDYDVSGNIIAREVGAGTYSSTGPTLTRDTVYSSTNAGAKINCSGLQYVFVSLAKEDLATFGVLSAVNTWTGNNYFTTGNVGIGTASPSGSLHTLGTTAIFVDRAGSAHLLLRSSNGTVSAPTGILSTNLLGRISFQGYDGTQWTTNSLAGVVASATENWSTTARGSQLQFLTTPNTTATAVERMTIDQAGNVGIGVTAPFKPLHVVAPGTGTTGNGLAPGIRIDNSDLTSAGTVAITLGGYDPGGTPRHAATIVAGKDGDWVTGSNYPGNLQFWTRPNSTADQIERMRIDSSGNVGIGTTSVSAPLHVERNQASETSLFINNTNASGYSALRIGPSDRGTNLDMLLYSSTTASGIRAGSRPLLFESGAGTERMRMDVNGNFGIGTGNPSGYDAKLAVYNGNFALTTTTNRLYLYYASATNHAYLSAATGGEILFANGTAAPSERMRIDTSGNVGIGVTSLATNTRLHIRDDNATTNEARAIVQSSDQRLNLAARWQAGVEQYSYISSTTASGAATDLRIRSGATDHIILTSVGRVGVGEMSPFCRFHVRSDVTGAAPATSGTTDAATIDRIHNNVVALDTGVMANGNIWLQGRNTGNFATSYPILLNPNPGSGITGALGFGTTAPRSIVHFATASAGQYFFFQNTSGAGGTALTSTDTYPITSGNGFIGYGGLFLLPGRWGNATTVDSHNVLYLSGAQRNTAAISSDIVFANWGYFTGTTTAAGHLGNATAQADAVKFNIRHTDNGGEFNQRLTFLARSATGTTVNALQIFSSGETVLPVVGQTDVNSVGFRGSPNNDLTGAYTLALTDAGRTVRKTSTTLRTVTIPADATVNFPLGTCIMLCNVVDGTSNSTTVGNLTVACAASGPTLVWLSGTTKNNRTSATNTQIAGGGSATLRKVAANLWTITGAGIS